MAISTKGPQVWFLNTAGLDYRAFDLETLADGRVLVAMGGSSGTNAALHTAILNLGTGQLGAIDTTTWTPTSFSGTVRRIDITPGNNGTALLTLHSTFSSAGGADSNFSLVTLPTTGGTQRDVDPRPVNPGAPEENTHDLFSTVHLPGGGYLVFFAEPGATGFTDLSNGIRMARFDETGRRVGGTETVIGETLVNPLINLQNNPEQPSAVMLGNGNIGLYYKENLSNGLPRFLYQELKTNGDLVGAAVEISQGGTRPTITSLDDGRQLATWFDVAAGRHKGRFIDADGDLAGGAFNISTGEQQPYSVGSVIAMKNGFAFSWNDTTNGLMMVQMFGLDGKAKSNPFLVTDTSSDFPFGSMFGIERHGDGLLGYVFGVEQGTFVSKLEGQVFSGESSIGLTRNGGAADETINGSAKDDRLNLNGGNDRSDAGAGNDVQIGGKGNDTMSGGAGFDRIDGGAGSDRIDGGAGIDLILGGDGNDNLTGGLGADRLTGGMGRDTMKGGAGADVFIFSGPSDVMTTVTDFNSAEGDKLKILINSYGYLGIFIPAIGTEANPTASGLYFNTNTHILSQDADGAGTYYERVNIAYLPGVDTLGRTDFLTF